MKERPIIMSGDSVRAILNGTKTQTRRLTWKPRVYPTSVYEGIIDGYHQWYESRGGVVYCRKCPFGVVGDRLWARETWRIMSMPEDPIRFQYRADMAVDEERDYEDCSWTWERYERWYGRQVQKVQEDCDKAGLSNNEDAPDYNWTVATCPTRWQPSIHMPKFAARIWLLITDVRPERLQEISPDDIYAEGYPREMIARVDPLLWFRDLWDNINGKRGYGFDTSPWVWVVSFQMNP